jgi:endonuclease/exonuclease/phosphatase (EEP) superfamily protein YafD
LASISLLGCLLAVLPAWRHPHWLVRDAEFARLQISLLLLFCLLLQMPWVRGGEAVPLLTALVTLLGAGWGFWHLRRYLPLWPHEVRKAAGRDAEARMRLLTANVQMENRETSAFLDLVNRYAPDVVITLESDQWWEDRLAALEGRYRHMVRVPLDNRYGMHLYSRLPLEDSQVTFLVEQDVPSIHTRVRLRNGQPVQLHILHPAPPSPTENTEARERDAEIIVVARRLSPEDGPTIVAGDFNDIPWSRTARLFRDISGLLDPRVGRGQFNTFHARIPFLRWPLDHIYHSAHFELAELRRLDSIGSDHFPLFADLVLADYGADPSPHSPQNADRHEARAITDQADVEPEDVPLPGQ